MSPCPLAREVPSTLHVRYLGASPWYPGYMFMHFSDVSRLYLITDFFHMHLPRQIWSVIHSKRVLLCILCWLHPLIRIFPLCVSLTYIKRFSQRLQCICPRFSFFHFVSDLLLFPRSFRYNFCREIKFCLLALFWVFVAFCMRPNISNWLQCICASLYGYF